MTASSVENPVFSALTMAFLKDTGWYDVDYAFSETFTYGHQMGCGFLSEACFLADGEPAFY